MRLAEFILDNIEPILKQWETFAGTLTPAADGLDSVGRRDHAEQMLRTIAADLQTPQSHAERILKSHGEGPELGETTAAQTHADIRQATGFTISLSTGDFAHACRSMVEEARAYHPDREIILQVAPSLAGSFDRARLEQVISNLISNLIGNAIEHGEAGAAVTVTLKAAGDDALLSVHNRGPVIDAAAKATLFDGSPYPRRSGQIWCWRGPWAWALYCLGHRQRSSGQHRGRVDCERRHHLQRAYPAAGGGGCSEVVAASDAKCAGVPNTPGVETVR